MTQPKLLLARALGQSAVRVVFDQAMRELGPTSAVDPQNPTVWVPGPGLPSVVSVTKVSGFEYDLFLSAPAPLASYTIGVLITVESAAGEKMDGGSLVVGFTVSVADLNVTSWSWTTPTDLEVVFSSPLMALPTYTLATELAQVVAYDPGARDIKLSAVDLVSPTVVALRFANPGTMGAGYTLLLNRESFVSTQGAVLSPADAQLPAYGQGLQPSVVSPIIGATPTSATLESTQVLSANGGWPLVAGAYEVTAPYSLGLEVSRPSASEIQFAQATLPPSQTVTVGVAARSLTLAAGSVWTAVSTQGPATQTQGLGTTTFTKTGAAPFEAVFTDANGPMDLLPRQLSTTVSVGFAGPPPVGDVTLLLFTFINTSASVVFKKLASGQAAWAIYNQSAVVAESQPEALAGAKSLRVVDNPDGGWLAVEVNGQVVLGVPYSALTKPPSGNNLSVVFGLGGPTGTSATFSSPGLSVISYVAHGLVGAETRDVLSFSARSATALVSALGPSTTTYAFGARAEYLDAVDALQVVVGITDMGAGFDVGSVELLTSTGDVFDEVLFTPAHVLADTREVVCVFMRPRQIQGVKAHVTVEVGATVYSSDVPVARVGEPALNTVLTRQPGDWSPRLRKNFLDLRQAAGPGVVVPGL